MSTLPTQSSDMLGRARANWPSLILALLLLAGFGLRMIDLTDPPLDFHPTRQYRGALIARSIFYQLSPADDPALQQAALSMRNLVAELEPPILETLVALGYLLAGEEALWVARIITSLFWMLGAWAIYRLAAQESSPPSALIGVAFYLFLPFGVYASRSFQPDPVMVAFTALTAWAALRWSQERSWRWTWTTGLFAALAIIFKAFAAYFIGAMLLVLVLYVYGWRQAWRQRQVWAMAALALLPSLIYYLSQSAEYTGGYIQNWVVALLPLAFEPGFYVRWLIFISDIFGFAILIAGLAGVIFARGAYRALLAGLWLGYIFYGVTLPHQTTTHNYYHLHLLLILALSLPPLIQPLIERLRQEQRGWQLAAAGVLLAAIAFQGWLARSTLLGQEFANVPPYWERVGAAVPSDSNTIALTQQYGHLLAYYGWRRVELWPTTAELNLAALRGNSQEEFAEFFTDRVGDAEYFLVTSLGQLEQQAQLSDYLYANFPIFDQDDGYLILDLRPEAGQSP